MNYTIPPKKMVLINILDILKRYSDENHKLSQKQIADILKNEYNTTVERKTIKRNIQTLIDFGYDIEYTETMRCIRNKNGEKEESSVSSDFYLVREFTDSELRLLIDSLMFNRYLPINQCKEMINKIEGLSNEYFKSRVGHVTNLSDYMPRNNQVFYTLEILDEAISKNKQVSLVYNSYGTDKKLHPRKDEPYIINPYQMVAVNDKYYLICNVDKYDNVANFRLDRITEIKILKSKVKPKKQVRGLENGLNLPKHMAEHIYMFSGDSVRVLFRVKKYLLSEIFDWFGKDITFSDENEEEVTCSVYVNEMAMRKWALQYALHVRVLSPRSMVESVKEDLKKAMENYGE